MNIQQLRYVVAIANSGTSVKLLKRCMLVSQVCLFHCAFGKRAGFKIFRRTVQGL